MNVLKFYAFPILVGAVAGMLTLWAFDGFSQQNRSFFVEAFFQSMVVAAIVVVIFRLPKKK